MRPCVPTAVSYHVLYAPNRFVRAPITSAMGVREIRSMKGAKSLHNLGAVACCVRVSLIPFLRYCCGLASSRPLMEESRTAAATERKDSDANDEGIERNVDLHARVSGLVVRDVYGVVDMCQIPAWVPILYVFPMPPCKI